MPAKPKLLNLSQIGRMSTKGSAATRGAAETIGRQEEGKVPGKGKGKGKEEFQEIAGHTHSRPSLIQVRARAGGV